MITINNTDAAEIAGFLEYASRNLDRQIRVKTQTVVIMEQNRDMEVKKIALTTNLDIPSADLSFDKALDTYKADIMKLRDARDKTKGYIDIIKFGSMSNVTVPNNVDVMI